MSELSFLTPLKNSRAFSLLKNDFGGGLGHAYMVVSNDDDVVDEFFALVACAVYCETHEPCLDCTECRKVLNGNNPDVFHLNEARAKIKVEDLQNFLSGMNIRAIGERKLYFIHRADLMNAQAQNKLLKTFEEPPENVTIFLGVSNEASMLETVKSRARTLYMDIFDEPTIYASLLSLGIDPASCSIAAACSEGQLGKALKIAKSPDYAELYRSCINLLKYLNRSSDIASLDSVLLSQKDIGTYLDVLSIILRDMLAGKEDDSLVLQKQIANDLETISGGFSRHALADILLAVNTARRKLSLNVNPTATVDSLLFTILEEKHKWQ